jgi:hypothetical protein
MLAERWNSGRIDKWILEIASFFLAQYSNIPLFQYSCIPVNHYSNTSGVQNSLLQRPRDMEI